MTPERKAELRAEFKRKTRGAVQRCKVKLRCKSALFAQLLINDRRNLIRRFYERGIL